jgi:hypothetical protein
MTRLAGENSEPTHERAADAEDVNVHKTCRAAREPALNESQRETDELGRNEAENPSP